MTDMENLQNGCLSAFLSHEFEIVQDGTINTAEIPEHKKIPLKGGYLSYLECDRAASKASSISRK